MAWFKENSHRFELEMRLMARNYPHARVFIKKGNIVIFLEVASKRCKYLAEIIYPADFPFSQPKAYIRSPKLPPIYHEIHRFDDGSLCLARPEQVGPQTSGKMICDWTHDWVKTYEVWKVTKVFPGGD